MRNHRSNQQKLSPSHTNQRSLQNPLSVASLERKSPQQTAARAALARNPSPIGSPRKQRKGSINNSNSKMRQPKERYESQQL